MKTFKTSGTGSGQSLSEIESERIPIYQTVADAEADLNNLEEGQIVMTPDEGAEELLHPVDVVEKDNTHAVQSGAVANALSYSTTEQKTGGYWIDGKPIYRKVMTNPSYSGTLQNEWVALTTIFPNQAPQNVDRVVLALGYYKSNTLGTTVYLGDVYTDGVKVNYPNRIDRATGEVSLVMEYTKTTD